MYTVLSLGETHTHTNTYARAHTHETLRTDTPRSLLYFYAFFFSKISEKLKILSEPKVELWSNGGWKFYKKAVFLFLNVKIKKKRKRSNGPCLFYFVCMWVGVFSGVNNEMYICLIFSNVKMKAVFVWSFLLSRWKLYYLYIFLMSRWRLYLFFFF